MKTKKIMHICLSGIVTEGFLYQDNLLAKYHYKMGYDVSFMTSSLCYNSKGEIVEDGRLRYVNRDGVRVYRLRRRKPHTLQPKLNRCLHVYETLCTEMPDIIFIHGPQFLDMPQVVKFVKKFSPEVYLDSHSDFSNSGRNWISRELVHKFLWRRMAKMIEPYCTRIYGVLPARVDFLHDIYGIASNKLELLVMGADDELTEMARANHSREKIRFKYGVKENDILIVTGGKIDKFKWQIMTLMKTVRKLNTPQVKLLVFGSVVREMKSEIDGLCSDNIKYIGWISPEDTYNYFEACDLAVFPGRHSVFWEQVAGQGKPMICKYWEGTTHVDMGGNVLFLEDDKEETILYKLMYLVNNSESLKEMKKVASEKGPQIFLYSKIAQKALS